MKKRVTIDKLFVLSAAPDGNVVSIYRNESKSRHYGERSVTFTSQTFKAEALQWVFKKFVYRGYKRRTAKGRANLVSSKPALFRANLVRPAA